jgi:hypothetical protein
MKPSRRLVHVSLADALAKGPPQSQQQRKGKRYSQTERLRGANVFEIALVGRSALFFFALLEHREAREWLLCHGIYHCASKLREVEFFAFELRIHYEFVFSNVTIMPGSTIVAVHPRSLANS